MNALSRNSSTLLGEWWRHRRDRQSDRLAQEDPIETAARMVQGALVFALVSAIAIGLVAFGVKASKVNTDIKMAKQETAAVRQIAAERSDTVRANLRRTPQATAPGSGFQPRAPCPTAGYASVCSTGHRVWRAAHDAATVPTRLCGFEGSPRIFHRLGRERRDAADRRASTRGAHQFGKPPVTLLCGRTRMTIRRSPFGYPMMNASPSSSGSAPQRQSAAKR